MRIAILTTQCPFVIGGAELHARQLERNLQDAGHKAEIVTMPFKWYPSTTVLDHMQAARSLDVSEFSGAKIDLAICLKFPAYLMRHPNKTFWILHQHRPAYDLWNQAHSDLGDDPNGRLVRDAIHEADTVEIGRAWRVFANSANVAKRLLHYNNIVAEPLYHPPPLAPRIHGGEFGNYFYYPSRITASKRQEFVIRSLKYSRSGCRVVFAGEPDNPDYGRELMELAQTLGVGDRIEWAGFVSDAEMINLYASARGILFTPIDEDLGYVALEAMLAGKPLLTLSDAGEPANLIRNDIEGFVVPPDARAFADVMDRLATSTNLAKTMGRAGLARYRALDISWANAIAKLTEPDEVVPRRHESGIMASLARGPITIAEPSETILPFTIDPPSDLNTASDSPLGHLAQRFEFDEHLTRHRRYYETHWTRYQSTIDYIARLGIDPRRIIELGTSAPYVFTALLKESFRDAEFKLVQESPTGMRWRDEIRGKEGGASNIEVEIFGLNVETTPLPFADGECDLVLAMEMLEHFAIDPSFVFREARRVLREGGVFLVTTPNLISLQGISRALDGGTPYSFGTFVPWNGVYGRHNREYTPFEVESLGHYAGFETAVLDTVDVYQQNEVPAALVHFMVEQGRSINLRGQNILYIGRKTNDVVSEPYPGNLFPIDPAIFSGRLELRRATGSSDGFIVQVANTSPLHWLCDGSSRVRLTVDRVDQDGRANIDVATFKLPRDLAPGGVAEIPIRTINNTGINSSWYEINLYAEGAGSFKGAGRSRGVCLFAERLERL